MANNYVLGRGELHFGQFKAGTQTAKGERYLGNTPEFSVNAEQETLDHYNSDRGIRNKDESVILQVDYTGALTTDNVNPENLAMFFLGEALNLTTAADTGLTDSFEDVELGLSYQLGAGDGSPAGSRNVENVVVNVGGSALVAGTDYVIDESLGRVTLLEEATGVSNGDTLDITFDVQESTRSQVISRSDSVEGTLRFIAVNPTGENVDFFMPWVKITPNGDFSLKADEWQTLPFNVEFLKKGNLEAIYADGRPFNG